VFLKDLRNLGNVIVVEHDEDIMQQADMIIDIGPEVGNVADI
jgi:excinuclease ABC subunit A